MKLVSFFLLSLSVHAAALAFPVTRGHRDHPQAFRVVILETGSSGAGADTSAGKEPARRRLTTAVSGASRFRPVVDSAKIRNSEAQTSTEEAPAKNTENRRALFAAPQALPEHQHVGLPGSPAGGLFDSTATGDGQESGEAGTGGLGTGAETGPGPGNGFGGGQGSTAAPTQITQASFRHAPAPEYPDAARKDGKEGRVLLRVLVDAEGRSKAVEISLSSGSQLLDQAAADAVKRWRFFPARHGDAPTASWIRIPVDFRLKEASR